MVLDRLTVRRLAARADLVRVFPFLAMTMRDPKACCKKTRRQPHYQGINAALAGMPPWRKQIFTQMTGLALS